MPTKKDQGRKAPSKPPVKKASKAVKPAVKAATTIAKTSARTKNPKTVPVVKTTKSGQRYVDRVVDHMAKG